MIYRIKSVEPLPDYKLRVLLDDGKCVIYDVGEDIVAIPSYEPLKTVYGLFGQVKMDDSRTCIYWNDVIDLPSDAIYEYGKAVVL